MVYAGQPSVLKWYNSQLIHRTVIEQGSMTKPELAQTTHLSLPTVNKIVEELVSNGLLLESDIPIENKVGRKAKSYTVAQNSANILIVYYLNGKWVGSTVDLLGGAIYHRQCAAIENEHTEIEILYSLLDDLAMHGTNIRAIGVGIPGVVMKSGLITSIPSIPSFENLNLQFFLDSRYHVPVYVENDVKLMALGYYTQKMDDADNIVFLYIGSGVGAGLIINGQLYKGNASFAGELGYMPADGDIGEASHSQDGGSMEYKLRSLCRSLKENPNTLEIRRQFCLQLSRMLAACTAMLNPEAIILYCSTLRSDDSEILYTQLKHFLPAHTIPQIRLTLNDGYGEIGLFHMCQEGVLNKCWLLDAVESNK